MGDDQTKPTDTGLPTGDAGTTPTVVPPVTPVDPNAGGTPAEPVVPTPDAGTPAMPGTEPTPAAPADGTGTGTPPATV